MAFAKAKEVKESVNYSKYIGMTTAHLEAINPTSEEYSKLTSRSVEVKDYVSNVKVKDLNGVEKDGKQNAITFIFSIENPKKGQEGESDKLYLRHVIYLSNSCVIGSNSGKIQIIDKWGRTAWCTKEEYDGKIIPVYKSGPAKISNTYRAALEGEEKLISSIKAFLGMNNTSERLSDGNYRELTEEELESRADEFACYIEPSDIKSIMAGNVKVLKDALEGCNDVKLILGIKHSDSGDYQQIYGIYKLNMSKTGKIEADIKEQNNDKYEYFVDGHIPNGLVEYSVAPTNVTKGSEDVKKPKDDSDLPF